MNCVLIKLKSPSLLAGDFCVIPNLLSLNRCILYSMEDTITSIADMTFDFLPTETAKSNRTALLKALYTLYTSQPEINRTENRKRYRYWMGKIHPELVKRKGFDPVKYARFKPDFKKAKLSKEEKFLTYIAEDRLWYFFTHVDVSGLEKLIAEARDTLHRYEMAHFEDKEKYNVARQIMGSVKYELG